VDEPISGVPSFERRAERGDRRRGPQSRPRSRTS